VLRERLSAPAPGPVSVSYATTAGTATSGADYTTYTGTLNFAAGEIEQTISVPIIDDGVIEPVDEIFRVTLSAPAGASLSLADTTVAIVDNDGTPPLADASFLQTGGPSYNTNGWNYYVTVDGGYTYMRVDVPCVAGSLPVQIDLYDAPIYTAAGTADTVTGGGDTTTFSLYQMPAGWSYADGLPGATATPVLTKLYPTAAVMPADRWETFITLPAPSCGVYLLRASTANNDVNSWGVRVGWQAATTTPPTPPTSSIDLLPGSGDEIFVGFQQMTLRFAPGANQCKTFYEYVRPGQAQALFHNYDLDSAMLTARVRYYGPSDAYDPLGLAGGWAGTASLDGVWNNSTNTTRVGDSIANPESGWWRIVTCTSDLATQNQLIQEGQTEQASYLTQPGTPALDISLTPAAATVAPGGSLSFSAVYTNTSSGLTAGAAIGTTFTVILPSDLTFVSCGGATCTQSGSTLTVSVGKVNAGATGTVTINTRASGGGIVGLGLRADYSDVLGNPFVGKAAAVATIN
jgi:hypothetical protein